MSNELTWGEKTPLALLMLAQALVIFRWYSGGMLPPAVVAMLPYATTMIALAASIALDLAVVTTAMGQRAGRKSVWGMLTTGSAMLFSSCVALDVYGVFPFGAWLHAAFPVVTFFYAQHLAVSAPHAPIADDAMTTMVASFETLGARLDHMNEAMGALGTIHGAYGTIAGNGVLSQHKGYECPHCGSQLDNAGQLGAATKWGYCKHCKPSTNGNGHGHDLRDTEVLV